VCGCSAEERFGALAPATKTTNNVMCNIMKLDLTKYKLITFFLFTGILSSCGMKEMINKTEKIRDIAFLHCECDDVRLINYSEQNFRTYAHLEIVGANGKSKKETAIQINEALKICISDYCKIDEFKLDFLNKGEHEIITIRYCKINE
jgi:hypothetical protein